MQNRKTDENASFERQSSWDFGERRLAAEPPTVNAESKLAIALERVLPLMGKRVVVRVSSSSMSGRTLVIFKGVLSHSFDVPAADREFDGDVVALSVLGPDHMALGGFYIYEKLLRLDAPTGTRHDEVTITVGDIELRFADRSPFGRPYAR